MLRALFAITVIALVVDSAAQAQDINLSLTSSSQQDSSMVDLSMPSEMPMDSDMSSMSPTKPFDMSTGYTRIDTDRLVTRVLGQPVYDGETDQANNLGNINDLVLNQDGSIAAVVLGVGGFLGLGEKQVAVAYSALQWVVATDNTERFVISTTVEELTNAPDFVTVDDDPSDAMATSSSSAM